MGLIKDGAVSGVLPSTQGFVVHYPGYPSSVSRAIDTLGGMQGILKARSSQSNKLEPSKLELHFRPEDTHSHPALGELRPCNNFLLKISKGKPDDDCHAKASDSKSKTRMENETQASEPVGDHTPADEEANLFADIVAHLPEAYCFNGMVDYQHVIPVHADIARRKKRNWLELEEPHFEKGGLMDVDQEDVMIILPQFFSPKDVPEDLVLKPPAPSGLKKRQEGIVQPNFEIDKEPVLAIDFDINDILTSIGLLTDGLKIRKDKILIHIAISNALLQFLLYLAFLQIPKIVNWEEYIPQGSDQWESQMAVSRLFDERPIWPKHSLTERLLDKGIKFSHGMLRRLLSRIAYYFSSGPFLRFWIKKGYDPRKDPESRIYQRMDYRVPVPLRSYCDAYSANKSKHTWEDICAFHVFPCKFQTSLQLFELVDDYIQSEIKKPPMQTTCTFETGWFTHHLLNCFRQRLMVRFLSAFPKPGAESILRAAAERFDKLKRECSKDTLKLDGEECQQTNSALEENEEHDNIEYDEDAAEGNNSEEEWDAYEELDLAEEDREIPLPSHSYMNMDISRTHLQELFDSFPSSVIDGDKAEDASDEEYQIYEQDSDDNYHDE